MKNLSILILFTTAVVTFWIMPSAENTVEWIGELVAYKSVMFLTGYLAYQMWKQKQKAQNP